MLLTQLILLLSLMGNVFSSAPVDIKTAKYFDWNNATVYFMLTDRFYNADSTNDVNFNRSDNAVPLRRFSGGDIKGISQKIKEGYFQKLGIDVIWFSPVIEQIHGFVDEGQGETYAFHGYWPRDWTAMEPNFGNKEDLKELMKLAHENNIRVLMDVIINHTGPVTELDPVWPSDWVRTEPQCTYQNFESTCFCTLVKNLPDILTEQAKAVELPNNLTQKWQKEGRLEKELAELDAFFQRTGYPKTPRYYIIKWITDFIREFGIDGFRVDTVKHTEADVWADLSKEAKTAFAEWKSNHPEAIQENQDFFMVGEVYNYNMLSGRLFDFGDLKVNYFENGFESLINFGFKGDANKDYEELFSSYSNQLNNGDLKNLTVLNYVSSHDDGQPFDVKREKTFESANKLLLSPGMAQIYYGDEIARPLIIEGAQGDVNLRGIMLWDTQDNQELLEHWQKIGQFRNQHPSVGAGEHKMISQNPYVFARSYVKGNKQDRVIVGLDLPKQTFILPIGEFYNDGDILYDFYGKEYYTVKDGSITIKTDNGIVLFSAFEK